MSVNAGTSIIFFFAAILPPITNTYFKMNIQNKVFTNYSDWQKAYHKNQNFNAITIDNELHPFETHNKEVFVYGKGWNKIVKKKIVCKNFILNIHNVVFNIKLPKLVFCCCNGLKLLLFCIVAFCRKKINQNSL